MTTSTTNTNFDTAFATYLNIVKEISLNFHKEEGFKCAPDTIETTNGRKYIKLIKQTSGTGRSVYGFVNKTNGDIHFASSWSAPAKGARGNIFNPDNGRGCSGPYGIKYKRGGLF